MRRDYLAANPKVVTALLVANHRAVARRTSLVKAGVDEIVKVGSPNWGATPEAQREWIETVLWKRRGWSWITEGDANTLVGLSTTKAIFQAALDPEATKKTFALGADVSKAAYDHVGARARPCGVRRQPRRHAGQAGVGGGGWALKA